MKKVRPFGLLGDVAYADEDPRQALEMGGGGASGATPNADAIGQFAYGLTNIGGLQDAAGLLGGPSLKENLQAGNKFDATMQGVGMIPVVGGAAKLAMAGIPKAAKAAAKMAKAAETVSEAAPQGIIAYHGSPHSFDRFDMSKIGTGEGAQAYGHGLYFAESEPVAKSYRDMLSQNRLELPNGQVVEPDWSDPTYNVVKALRESNGDWDAAKASLGKLRPQDWADEALVKANEYHAAGAQLPPNGSMYQVRINADPEHFLDWDKPLSEQSPVVQEAADEMKAKSFLARRALNASDATGKTVWEKSRNAFVTGAGVGNDAAASSMLREAGIPGIKYLDQGSRSAGEGSRNYVVFDDNLVEILKKYGLVGLLGGGSAMGALHSPNAQQGAPAL